MAYSSGMMNKRVKVAKRYVDTDSADNFGKSGQPKYEILGTFWMGETFTKGVKAMHEGALDAYDTVMFRCRYNAEIDRWCLLQYQGKWYQIQSFNADYQQNQIQITATEMANQNVTIVEPTPEPEPTPTPTPEPASNAGTTDETTPDAEETGTETNTPVNPEPQNEG